MSVSLLDIDNKLIQLRRSIANGSNVLKKYFETNPDKVYKIEYNHLIISQIISILQDDEDVVITDSVTDLCSLLQIDKINNYLDNELDYETEFVVENIAHYICENIFLKENSIYCKKKYLVKHDPYVVLKDNGNEIMFKSQSELQKFGQKYYQKNLNANYTDKLSSVVGKEIVLHTFNIGQLVNDKFEEIKMNKYLTKSLNY